MARAKIYWNSNKKCFSVCDEKSNKVIGHKKSLLLKDCTLRVQPGGRERVRREKAKTVHAFVIGTPTNTLGDKFTGFEVFGYNPYRNDTFVRMDDQKPVTQADLVIMISRDGSPVCKGINLR
jgi:hypothetical protein